MFSFIVFLLNRNDMIINKFHSPMIKFITSFSVSVLILLIIHIEDANAQDTRNFFSVSGGYSLPVGELATEKLNDPLAGLAGSGYFGHVNYDHRIARWLGVRISGSLNQNSTNSAPIIDKANSYIAATGRTYNWDSSVSKWKLGAALIGPAIYFNMNRVQIEAHVQGGIVRATTPSVLLTGKEINASGQWVEGSQGIEVSLNQATVTPLGFGAGLSLRLPLFGALFFQLSGDVIGAKAKVSDLAIRAKIGQFEHNDRINESRFIGVVNIGAGLGIAF